MILWLFVLVFSCLLGIASVLFLISRVHRLGFLKKYSITHRKGTWLLSAGIVILFLILLTCTMGLTNTIIVVIHLVGFWLLTELVQFLLFRKKSVRKPWAGHGAILLTVLYLSAGWYGAHHVWRTAYELDTEKDCGQIRVVQISDAHVGTTFHAEGFAEHLQDIQAENPDVVVITGDFVDDSTARADLLGGL